MTDLTKEHQIKIVHMLHQFIKISNETDGSEQNQLCSEQAVKAETFLREVFSK